MRAQPRFLFVVTRWTLGMAALVAALFIVGCSSSGNSSTSTPAQFSVTTTSGQLVAATINSVYPGATLTAANGTAPYMWTVTSGALPTGLMLSTAGVLSGAPTQSGAFNFTVTVMDSAGHTATANLTVTVNQVSAITSGTSTTFTAGAAGTFTVTATGFPAPTFSETGALPAGVTLTSAGILSGTPGAGTGGVYAITITAQNGVTPNATQSFTLTVEQPPTFTSQNSTTFPLGVMGTFTVTASGYPTPTFSEVGALPTGVSFNSNGTLSGIPGSGTQGSYPITITAQNGLTPNATQGFTLTVGFAPAITSGTSTTFTAGAAGTFTVTATGFPTPTFSETGALPTGVTLSSAGLLSGTPGAGTGAVYAITITAQNGVTPTAAQSFTLIVDQAPAFTSQNNTTFPLGVMGTFTVTASGYPAPTFSEVGALPTGVSFNSNGTLSGIPGAGTAGAYPITITAQNGVTPTAAQNFSLLVGSTATTISSIVVNPGSVLGGDNVTGTVTLNGIAPSGGTVVTLTGSATSPAVAVVPASVTVAAGSSVANFTVTTLPPATGNPTQITVSGTFNGTQQTALWVTPLGSLSSVQLVSQSLTGGASGAAGDTTLTVALNAVAPTGGVVVNLANSNTAVALLSASTLTIPAGSTSAHVNVGTNTVTSVTQVTLGASYNNETLNATLTVNPTGSLFVSALTTTPSAVVGGGATSVTGTVTLSTAPASNTVVALTTSNLGAAVPSSVTVLASQTTANFTVTTSAVTSSTGVTLSGALNGQTESGNLTLNPPLAVTTTALPLGETGMAYPTTSLARTGGGTGPFTWSLINGTTLPSPMALSSTGVITGTPTSPSTTPPPTFTVQVQDGQGDTATASLSIRVDSPPSSSLNSCGPTLGNESILIGYYAFVGQGYVGSSPTAPVALNGSFIANGTGGITGGEEHINTSTSSGAQNLTITGGFFNLGSDNRGCVELIYSGSSTPTIFHIAVSGVLNGSNDATRGNFIEFDNYSGTGTDVQGELRLQDTADFSLATLNTRYTYGFDGVDINGGHFGTTGSLSLNTSTGAISNLAFDLNDAGNLESGITGGTGSFGSISANGGALVTLNFPASAGGVSVIDQIIIVNKNEFFVVGTEPYSSSFAIYSGKTIVTASSYSANSLADTFIFQGTGTDIGGNGVQGCSQTTPCASLNLGVMAFNPSTLALSGTSFNEEAGVAQESSVSNSTNSTTYAVNTATGRTPVSSSGSGGNSQPVVLYIATPVSSATSPTDFTDPISAFLLGSGLTSTTGDPTAFLGFAEVQPNPNTYSDSSVTSPPIYVLASPEAGQPGANFVVGTISFTSASGTGTRDVSSTAGLEINGSITQSFAINSDGTGSGAAGDISDEVTNGTAVFSIAPNATIDFVRSFTQ